MPETTTALRQRSWSLAEHSSSGAQNEDNHNEWKMDHGLSSSVSVSANAGPRLEEKWYEPNSLFVESSNYDAVPQILNLDAGLVGHGDDNRQVTEQSNLYKPSGSRNEQISPGPDSCCTSCKRKALEANVGQSSSSGSSSSLNRADGISASYNAGSSVNTSAPTRQVDPRLEFEVRGSGSDSIPGPNLLTTAEGSLLFHLCSSHQDLFQLIILSIQAQHRCATPQNPNAVIHVPALPRNLQPFRWNGGSGLRAASSSSSNVSGDREAVRDEGHQSRRMARNLPGHPMFVASPELRTSIRNSTNQGLRSGNINVPVNGASTSRAGPSSGANPLLKVKQWTKLKVQTKEKTTVGLMAALSSMYEKPSTSNKVHLMRRLFNLRMTEGASVAQHLNELNTITTQLSSVEIEFDDEVRALILLSSLPDSWNATVTAVSSSSGNSKLKFDDVQDLILSEEIRRRESGEASTSSALYKESKGRTSERNSNRGRSKSRTGKSRMGKKDFTCYNCGKKGHFKRDCRAPKKNTGAQDSANVIEETGDAMILSVNSLIESWILDSGASFHPTPCREIMENYVNGDFGKVYLADDETLKIVEKGDIRLKLPNQTTWTLKGVRHISDLKRNLISVRQLDGEGFSTTFSGCEWKITKGALVIARGKKIVTLYITSNLENIIAVADADGKSNLWHQRLGHMSEKGMKTLLLKGKLPDLMNVYVGLCEDCIFGKQKKVSFAKIGKTPKAEKLELIHTDIWGPSPIPSLAGSLYYVTFIDESTRKVWVYFLKKKSEVFDTFRKWKDVVENETDGDNSSHDTVAEHMNRTLNEHARSMRIHTGLPKFLWAEAINTAAYLINRGPSVHLDGRIPEEVWRKKEINISHLRVFGCISYVDINSAERSKLDVKSNKCVFVGYGGDEFGYQSIIESSSSNIEAKTKEFAEFEEISGNDVQISPEAVQEEPGTLELRRSSRIPKPTQRYSPSLHYLLLTDNGEPECYDEAMQVEDSVKWESSMKDEMDSLMSNQTWELAELPPDKKALHNKWIYRIKEEHDGRKRYKARFVVKGFQQKECIDYNEIFSPVVKLSTIRLVLKIVAAENLHLEQLDVFLHGDLEEKIYMRQPEGFIEAGKKNLFAMKDLGAAKQILGMRIKRDTKSGTLMLSQAEYINKVLSRFNMQDAKPVSTPLGVHFRLSKEQSPKTEEERVHMVKVSYASAIGSLMYAMVCTRPDIAHAVGAVSRYMNNPGKVRWEAVKWILRYLRGTTNKALCFKGGDNILTGYIDADLSGNVDIRRSTTGSRICRCYGSQQGDGLAPKFLGRVRQETRKQCLVLRQSKYYPSSKESVFSFQDKAHTITVSFYPVSLEDGILKLENISGAQNPADMLTKTVTTDKLKLCSTSVGMLELSELVRRSLISSLAAESGGQGNRHLIGIPHSLRTLAAAIEGRSRLVIRNVLDLMHRGKNLRFEDVMILDQSVVSGIADMHERHRGMRLDDDNMSYEELLALEERIGYVSTGLSEDTISNRLKRQK
ncbi:Detected protein of unknown function [Hibiscus syriacus]|uniref:CCHC-type domain-containing protein n=1 Tax=Hibiscus syriacus TaxID=106335 RepID=A0A6A3CV90_HIBSY|nr:Detected protein of unknown function [Hibiscus syriacus]